MTEKLPVCQSCNRRHPADPGGVVGPERLKCIRKTLDRTPPGPWRTAFYQSGTTWLGCGQPWKRGHLQAHFNMRDSSPRGEDEEGEVDSMKMAAAHFCAQARTDLPDCVDEIERLREIMTEVQGKLAEEGLRGNYTAREARARLRQALILEEDDA
jgi:hypothetical protein